MAIAMAIAIITAITAITIATMAIEEVIKRTTIIYSVENKL